MSSHKSIDRICCIVLALVLMVTALLFHAEALGVTVNQTVMGYETRLFDTDRVHTIEIVMSTKVRDYVPNQVTYNTVDSFVIRDADGNEVFRSQSGEPHEFKTGVDENGAPYVYESFGVDGENYLITIRYGTLNITYRK